MARKKRYWHFVGKTLRDGSPIPADGAWLEWKGECVMCKSGLHASPTPFDALQYVPGDTLCLVECDQIKDRQDDKIVCRRRKIIARMDAAEMLRYFARMQAVSVVHLWDAPDNVLDYLMTGDDKIRAAAWAAARAAAWAAARAAARAAAWDTAWAAARAAARNEFNQIVYECFEDFL